MGELRMMVTAALVGTDLTATQWLRVGAEVAPAGVEMDANGDDALQRLMTADAAEIEARIAAAPDAAVYRASALVGAWLPAVAS